MREKVLSAEDSLTNALQEAEQERNARIEVEVRAQRLSLQVEELRAKTDRGDYKSMNFDQVRRYGENNFSPPSIAAIF